MSLAFAEGNPYPPANLDFDRGTYFSVQLQQSPAFKENLKLAEKSHGAPLHTRGESHLTVVTPPEYLKLKAEDRKALTAALKKIDWSKPQITIKCIGRGQAVLQDKVESAYFLVVDAPEVRAAREKFQLVDYYPHITLGFTKRDLHFEDKVQKDESSCVKDLTPAK